MSVNKNIASVINQNLIKIKLKENDQKGVIAELAELLKKENKITSVEEFTRDVLERENDMPTNVGFGIAIPHARSVSVQEAALAFGKSEGMSWNNSIIDSVRLVFLLAVPETNANKQHIKILSSLSRMLLNEDFRECLLMAENANEVIQAIEEVIIDK